MKGGETHRVPLTSEMLEILEPLKALNSQSRLRGAEAAPAALQHGDADAASADGGRRRDGPWLQEHVSRLGSGGRERSA